MDLNYQIFQNYISTMQMRMILICSADFSTGEGVCQYLFMGMVELGHSCIMALLIEEKRKNEHIPEKRF